MEQSQILEQTLPTEEDVRKSRSKELDDLFENTQDNLKKIADLLPRKASMPRITTAAQNIKQAQIEQNM